MYQTVDPMNVATGWTASGTATIYGLNDHAEFIAGLYNKSLVFTFSAINDYVQKIYTIDVTNYSELVLHVWSQTLNKTEYRYGTDFDYKIDLGAGKEYYLKAATGFNSVVIDISDIASIDRIRITCLTDPATVDYLLVSNIIICNDEMPLDIFNGIKEQVENDINSNYLTTFLVGTITATAGATSITFATDVPWLDRYAMIRIYDGVNTEYHHIESRDRRTVTFSTLYSGAAIVNSFVNASVYLYIPVEFGRRQVEVVLPSITFWGISPEVVNISSDIENVLDNQKPDNTFRERQVGLYFDYEILMDCEAREDELLNFISSVVKANIGKRKIWVNGRKINIDFNGAATEVEPVDAFDLIPKIQYPCKVQVREDIYTRQSLPRTTVIDVTTTIE